MPFSKSTLDELRTELTGLHQLKAKIDARVAAIESVLTPFDFQGALPFASPNGKHGTSSALPQTPKAEDRNPYANTGLRAAILDVLRTHGAQRAPDVAEILVRQGFKDDSSTPLPTRVYNDLWRLGQKDGTVVNESGVFRVK
jgi:hypothetical protein